MIIRSAEVEVELDERFPRPVRYRRGRHELLAADPAAEYAVEIDGVRYGSAELACDRTGRMGGCRYRVRVVPTGVTIDVDFALEGAVLAITVAGVGETPPVGRIRFAGMTLARGLAARGDAYLRHVTRQINWSRHWGPGTGAYQHWEDTGAVADAMAEPGGQWTSHAAVWNDGICLAFRPSVRAKPLVSELSAEGAGAAGRAGAFTVTPGTWAHRLRGTPAEPFRMLVGILGDYNGDGTVNWSDAANWEGDHTYRPHPLYDEGTVVYKLGLDDPKPAAPQFTFDDCLHEIATMAKAIDGRRQVCYLVGWQHTGHDTGYPCHTVINERLGGIEGLRRLIEQAQAYNCIVSLHGNWDDTMSTMPVSATTRATSTISAISSPTSTTAPCRVAPAIMNQPTIVAGFPRPQRRGPTEAAAPPTGAPSRRCFPRPQRRGPIEADFAPLRRRRR